MTDAEQSCEPLCVVDPERVHANDPSLSLVILLISIPTK